jgi:hypothetical protein
MNTMAMTRSEVWKAIQAEARLSVQKTGAIQTEAQQVAQYLSTPAGRVLNEMYNGAKPDEYAVKKDSTFPNPPVPSQRDRAWQKIADAATTLMNQQPRKYPTHASAVAAHLATPDGARAYQEYCEAKH